MTHYVRDDRGSVALKVRDARMRVAKEVRDDRRRVTHDARDRSLSLLNAAIVAGGSHAPYVNEWVRP